MDNASKNVVMLIDDSSIDAFINQKMIQNVGFADKIYIHTISESALEFFRNFEKLPELPHSLLPTLILLDLSMPKMDGFEFLEELDKIKKELTKNVKVVFVTSSTNTEDMERATHYSKVVKFLSKPLTADHLKELQVY